MYSYEERKKAVEWYYKLGSIKAVQHLLEYPSKNTLKAWMKEFEGTDGLHRRGCGQNPGPNKLSLGGFACIRMKRESKL